MGNEPQKPEEQPKVTTPDLRIISNGAASVLSIKDKEGVEHFLPPLTMQDILEFEDTLGASIFQIMNVNLSLRHIMQLLYLSLRKEGVSKGDVESGKYKYTFKQVADLFDGRFIMRSAQIFMDLLSVSGFSKEKNENPLEASREPGTEEQKEKASTGTE